MTTEITNLAPAPVTYATINTDSGTYTVPCEPINDRFVITPSLGMDENGKVWFTGLFGITHLPTGLAFSTSEGCINCARACGRTLVKMDLDWSGFDAGTTPGPDWVAALTDEQKMDLSVARNIAFLCDAEYCDEPDDDADEPAEVAASA